MRAILLATPTRTRISGRCREPRRHSGRRDECEHLILCAEKDNVTSTSRRTRSKPASRRCIRSHRRGARGPLRRGLDGLPGHLRRDSEIRPPRKVNVLRGRGGLAHGLFLRISGATRTCPSGSGTGSSTGFTWCSSGSAATNAWKRSSSSTPQTATGASAAAAGPLRLERLWLPRSSGPRRDRRPAAREHQGGRLRSEDHDVRRLVRSRRRSDGQIGASTATVSSSTSPSIRPSRTAPSRRSAFVYVTESNADVARVAAERRTPGLARGTDPGIQESESDGPVGGPPRAPRAITPARRI